MLTTAYGDGLLSDATLALRLDELLGCAVIDPEHLVGDLSHRRPRGSPGDRLRETFTEWDGRRRWWRASAQAPLLGLDWSGQTTELTLGRDPACDVVLGDQTVSRRHVALHFRDGCWILHDLGSRNGTSVNGRRAIRCRVAPGDRIQLADQALVVD